ncbi:MAG: type II secretion system F family protein [Deltaproteobacteria bacterium]|nr:type II secretion system F family protein [Deltaproteobacteria bacterium]
MSGLLSILVWCVIHDAMGWWETRSPRRLDLRGTMEDPPWVTRSLLLRLTLPMARCSAEAVRRGAQRSRWRWCRQGVLVSGGTGTYAVPCGDWLTMTMQSLILAGCGLLVGSCAPAATHVVMLCGAGSGALLPWHAMRHGLRRWRAEILRDCEEMVELFALAVEAGLEIPVALARLVEVMPASPWRNLMGQLHCELRLGQAPTKAWQTLATAVALPPVDAFVTLLRSADSRGTPIATLLHREVERMHAARYRRAEVAGILAGQKILLPMILCILPGYFLLVLSGIILHLFGAGLTQGLGGWLW